MSDLLLALVIGAAGLVVLAWSLVSQARWRRDHRAAPITCPAWNEYPIGRHHACARERGHDGYHRWERSKVAR